MTQARQPAFFAELGVSDTPEGRAGMIMLHVFLVLERLRHLGAPEEGLARALTEAFVTDMDDCMREMGVGDLTVPKKVKRAAAELRVRSLAYRHAMTAQEGALSAELAATVPGLEGPSAGARSLALYVHAAAHHLEAQDDLALLSGRVTFPAAEQRSIEPAPETAR